jgi:hypothetical protein
MCTYHATTTEHILLHTTHVSTDIHTNSNGKKKFAHNRTRNVLKYVSNDVFPGHIRFKHMDTALISIDDSSDYKDGCLCPDDGGSKDL